MLREGAVQRQREWLHALFLLHPLSGQLVAHWQLEHIEPGCIDKHQLATLLFAVYLNAQNLQGEAATIIQHNIGQKIFTFCPQLQHKLLVVMLADHALHIDHAQQLAEDLTKSFVALAGSQMHLCNSGKAIFVPRQQFCQSIVLVTAAFPRRMLQDALSTSPPKAPVTRDGVDLSIVLRGMTAALLHPTLCDTVASPLQTSAKAHLHVDVSKNSCFPWRRRYARNTARRPAPKTCELDARIVSVMAAANTDIHFAEVSKCQSPGSLVREVVAAKRNGNWLSLLEAGWARHEDAAVDAVGESELHGYFIFILRPPLLVRVAMTTNFFLESSEVFHIVSKIVAWSAPWLESLRLAMIFENSRARPTLDL